MSLQPLEHMSIDVVKLINIQFDGQVMGLSMHRSNDGHNPYNLLIFYNILL